MYVDDDNRMGWDGMTQDIYIYIYMRHNREGSGEALSN